MAEEKDENAPINRIIKCLHFYHTLKPSEYESLLEYFTKENYPHLIDDFNSILMEDLGDDKSQIQSRKEFESIYNKITTLIKDAKLEDSAIFKRNQRTRETTNLFEDDGILNVKGDELQKLKFYIEALDTIYVYFLFSYDIGCRLKDSDIKGEAPALSETEDSIGQRMGDVIMEQKEVDEIHTDSLFQNLQKLLKPKRELLTKINVTDFKNTRFVTKIDEDESVKYPEVVPPLQRKVTSENDDEKKDKDDEKTYIINSFGYTFYYWDHYKDKKGGERVLQNNGYTYSRLYVVAKYKNLQEELLNNTIKCIDKEKYDFSVYNAQIRLESKYAKSQDVASYGSTCLYYGIQKQAPMDLEHLLSVIVFCHYIELSKAFIKTHRKILAKESIVDVKKRNTEFAVLSRILRETVECYGRTMQFAKNKRLYHGVNGKLVFPGFCARFSCPSLLTTQLPVAAVYANANENGIILEVERGSGKLRFFNCNWLSCFSADESRLVMGGEYDIKIGSIYGVKEGFNYKLYLRAMNYFRYWVSGKEPIGTDYGTSTLKAKKTDYKILKSLFKHFDDRSDFRNKFPEYVNMMFDVFRTNIKDIKLDQKLMNKHYNRIAELLFDLSENNYNQLLIGELCMLFPYCLTITVTYKKFEMPSMDDWELMTDLGEAAKYTKKALTIIINNIECDDNSLHVINNHEATKGVWKTKRQGKNGLEITFVRNKDV